MKINAVIPIDGLKPLESISEITETSELYYRLTTKFRNEVLYCKIDNPIEFVGKDPRMNDQEYIKHHNFLIK